MAYACNCGNGDSDGFCNGSCLAVDAECGEGEMDEGTFEEDLDVGEEGSPG